MVKIFYVCSYGGCGSKMLCKYLERFGKVEHVHSRCPPEKLEYIGKNAGGKTYVEWFNGIKIPENKVNNYYVIYLYRDPIKAIYSRFIKGSANHNEHLKHIQIKHSELTDILREKKDLYGIREFFDNYVKKIDKNYKIYCVKYEDFFENQEEFNETFGIPVKNKAPPRRERTKIYPEQEVKILKEIYSDLIEEMNHKKFIEII